MNFLKMIWNCNKNFEYLEYKEGEDSDEDAKSEEVSVDEAPRKIFLYDELIK